ncbi:hypothetical protein ASPWEDRAFT_45220 [Aspergillus wentii DTO 134E9]|uniref:Uncharacterized protein n=1 Tax=Aspergillus wentii DTO 134E9 TaxID=1073089 RepID=A0A1L9R8M6_ASPWE|nr:uncharacterized protein ASPWEDRAFT_45220 [Aspergillus wentii DTO 134E9]KAI9925076.1 hypothetical protein MW887_006484 [Aspergillus wentii]OJJ31254.1 hypothetical protein ASPWEDRAFT_45220 [Aspergillus wentii DTO 134E9]
MTMSGSFEPISRRPSQPNTRIPPIMAKNASLQTPYKLATISHSKLRQEADSKTPNLRRCIAHAGILRQSIETTQRDINKQMHSFHLDEEEVEEEEEEEEVPVTVTKSEVDISPIREHITAAVKAMIRRRSQGSKGGEANNLTRVEAHGSVISSDKKNVVLRKYAAKLVPSRKVWSSPVLQASAAG